MAMIADVQPVGPTNEQQIAAFEKHIGYSLPAAYRDFLVTCNGGRPVPDAFTLTTDLHGSEEDLVLCFFPLCDLSVNYVDVTVEQLPTWPLHCAWNDLQNDLKNMYKMDLDPPLLPIGTDGSGNYISLVLTGDYAGAVVFLDHETAESWPLADSFLAFLQSLHRRERTDYHPMFGTGE